MKGRERQCKKKKDRSYNTRGRRKRSKNRKKGCGADWGRKQSLRSARMGPNVPHRHSEARSRASKKKDATLGCFGERYYLPKEAKGLVTKTS